jgi:hypothetical protein
LLEDFWNDQSGISFAFNNDAGVDSISGRLKLKSSRSQLAKWFILAAGLFAAGCASGPRIVTNGDPAADWSSYRTFGFFQPLGTDRGNVRSLMSNQLIQSTTREMQAAGFTLAESSPDLLINFVVSTRETIQTRPSTSASMHHSRGRYGTWSGWSAGMSTTEVVQRTEGTLAVDIVDRARNQLVWEGAATKRVTDSTRANQDQVLDDAIAEIFARFP